MQISHRAEAEVPPEADIFVRPGILLKKDKIKFQHSMKLNFRKHWYFWVDWQANATFSKESQEKYLAME